jgi:endonuclease/exonuclease/phosphatase family metal-dependent hydrolase
VALLQEIAHGDELEAALRTRYPAVEVAGQFVLASRFAIQSQVDPPKLPYGKQVRSPRYLQRVLETPLGPIAFYNVHPDSPRPDFAALRGRGLRQELLTGRLFSGSSAGLIDFNARLREQEVRSFAESARAEPMPVVIAGDTNLPGLSKTLGRYLASFQDGFERAGWGLGYTYPNDRKPWMRIDRILSSEQLRFVRFEVADSQASDHLCVVADLQRRSR